MVRRIRMPTPLEIATVVLGKRSADIARGDNRGEKSATKLMRQLRLRILKCIVEAIPLPRDIVLSAIRRASAPQSFTDGNGHWQENEWRISLSVACALIRKEQADKREEEIEEILRALVRCTGVRQMFAFKKGKKDEEESDAVSIGIRGPVSIQPAFSLEPVTSSQITKSVNLEAGADPTRKPRTRWA